MLAQCLLYVKLLSWTTMGILPPPHRFDMKEMFVEERGRNWTQKKKSRDIKINSKGPHSIQF